VVITSFLLLILSLIPLAVATGLFLYWRPLPIAAIAFSTGAAGLLLGAESFGLMHLLGRSLERLEPTQVG
jgi:thiamine transporter ThiT